MPNTILLQLLDGLCIETVPAPSDALDAMNNAACGHIFYCTQLTALPKGTTSDGASSCYHVVTQNSERQRQSIRSGCSGIACTHKHSTSHLCNVHEQALHNLYAAFRGHMKVWQLHGCEIRSLHLII